MTEEEIAELRQQLDTATASIAKLTETNKELKTEKAAAKKAADAALVEKEEAAALAAEKSGDVESIKSTLQKSHASELKKLQDALSERDSKLSTLVIDNSINEAIAKHGVLPHFAPAVTAMLKHGVKMENGEAFSGDVPLSDHLSTWFGSDEAKHFISAPANSGAGASGSTTAPGQQIKTVTEFMALAQRDRAAAKNANVDPSLESLKKSLG